MKTVLISAGHSTVAPKDPGATAFGQTEAALALRLRDAVAALLRAANVPTLTDGAPFASLPLTEALRLAKQAAIRVEIHFNAATPAATGVEALAHLGAKTLAQRLAMAVASATGLGLRGELGYKTTDSGQHHRLAFCEAGGVILEVCFLTNKRDLDAFLANESRVAKAVAQVLVDAARGAA